MPYSRFVFIKVKFKDDMSEECLNCNAPTENNFCSVCGQKTSTHRFSLKHFILHDFIHGVFHLDKGFLYTIKELFTRPGHSIREFVQGKRITHFNYFTLLLIILATDHFIRTYSSVNLEDVYGKKYYSGYLKLFESYNKIIKLIGIPFWSLVTWLLFRKSKQNYMENVVMNIYLMCGTLLVFMLFSISAVFYNDVSGLKTVKNVINFLSYMYIYYFIYQYFSVFNYKNYALILRSFFATFFIVYIQALIIFFSDVVGKTYFH